METDTLQLWKKFAAMEMPQNLRCMPRASEDTNNLEAIARIYHEARAILDEGDSLIKKEEIPFSDEDTFVLFAAILHLDGRKNIKMPDENKVVEVLEDIARFYKMKSTRSKHERFRVQQETHARAEKEHWLLNQGTAGVREVFEVPSLAGFTKEAKNPDGTISFDRAARKMEEIQEQQKMYDGSTPRMMQGRSPKMQDLESSSVALSSDQRRNLRAYDGIQQLLDDLRATFSMPVPERIETYDSYEVLSLAPGK